MHIQKLLLQLNENSAFDSKSNIVNSYKTKGKSLKTIEDFEKNLKAVYPEYFSSQTNLIKSIKEKGGNIKDYRQSMQRAGVGDIWKNRQGLKTPIPEHAYPFYASFYESLNKKLKSDSRASDYFIVLVNTALRGKDPINIDLAELQNFLKNVSDIKGFYRVDSKEDSEEELELKALNFLSASYKEFIDNGADQDAFNSLKDGTKATKKDDIEDFEKERPKGAPKASKEFKDIKNSLKNAGYEFNEEADKILNSLINKYPEEKMTADVIRVSFSLLDGNVPDTTTIKISGEEFTKGELKRILNGMEESVIESLKYELMEYNAPPRVKKLIDLIRDGKTKEELLDGDVEKSTEEEDVKGQAVQINRIKERTIKRKTKIVEIGSTLKDFLTKIEVPTAKIRDRNDKIALGTAAFDAIIQGLNTQKKEEKNETEQTK